MVLTFPFFLQVDLQTGFVLWRGIFLFYLHFAADFSCFFAFHISSVVTVPNLYLLISLSFDEILDIFVF